MKVQWRKWYVIFFREIIDFSLLTIMSDNDFFSAGIELHLLYTISHIVQYNKQKLIKFYLSVNNLRLTKKQIKISIIPKLSLSLEKERERRERKNDFLSFPLSLSLERERGSYLERDGTFTKLWHYQVIEISRVKYF